MKHGPPDHPDTRVVVHVQKRQLLFFLACSDFVGGWVPFSLSVFLSLAVFLSRSLSHMLGLSSLHTETAAAACPCLRSGLRCATMLSLRVVGGVLLSVRVWDFGFEGWWLRWMIERFRFSLTSRGGFGGLGAQGVRSV